MVIEAPASDISYLFITTNYGVMGGVVTDGQLFFHSRHEEKHKTGAAENGWLVLRAF
jgi:hypothetical protein